MNKSFVKIVVTATVEMSPEEFIKKYNTVLIERLGLCIQAITGDSLNPMVEDFEIVGIESA